MLRFWELCLDHFIRPGGFTFEIGVSITVLEPLEQGELNRKGAEAARLIMEKGRWAALGWEVLESETERSILFYKELGEQTLTVCLEF